MNRRKSLAKSSNKSAKGHFRIIGGHWRGKKLEFPAVEGLRPTPDRIRETLFNWLQGELENKHCLDIFCGSGALGLEALSRGAASCDFFDKSMPALNAINAHLIAIPQGLGNTFCTQLPQGLESASTKADVIFLDPPYALGKHRECLDILENASKINDQAWIYIENASNEPLPSLSPAYSLYRHKKAGQVQYALFQYDASLSQQDSL